MKEEHNTEKTKKKKIKKNRERVRKKVRRLHTTDQQIE